MDLKALIRGGFNARQARTLIGQAGAAPTDFARWKAANWGAFEAALAGPPTSSSGTTVKLDDSPEWADPDEGENGTARPVVTETGLYLVQLFGATADAVGALNLRVYGPEWADVPAFTTAISRLWALEPEGYTGGYGNVSVTTTLLAGTHFDVTTQIAPEQFNDIDLLIQRVG